MVQQAFPAAYNDYKNFNVYLTALLKLTTCFTSETNNLNANHMSLDSEKNPPMSKELEKLIKNPLNIKVDWDLDKCDIARTNKINLFGGCQDFCRTFNIAKPSPILDGDLENMELIYQYMNQFKKYFRTEQKNLFRDDLVELEEKIQHHKDEMDYFQLFYKSVDALIDVSDYPSEFTKEGVNPMKMADKGDLLFNYKFSWILAVSKVLLLFI